MPYDIIGRIIFFLKLTVYSIPFTAAGWLAKPLAPRLSPAATLLIMTGCLIFGFLVLVFTHEDMWDEKNPPLHVFTKIVFFIFGTFAIACIFNLHGGDPVMMQIFWAPLALLQAQVFFRVTFTEDM